MGLRDDKKAATRAAIIETALAMFRTLGFQRARVQDVVRQLRISEATFFNYFPTKQSVLDAAAHDLVSRSLELLRSEATDDQRTVRERLELVARAFAGNFEGDRELAVLLATHTRFLLVGSDRDTEGRQLLTRLFAAGQARGEVRALAAPRHLTDLYLAGSLATINGWLADRIEDESLEDRLLAAQQVFWTGVDGAAQDTAT